MPIVGLTQNLHGKNKKKKTHYSIKMPKYSNAILTLSSS